MASESTFGSHNPFRRKSSNTSGAGAAPPSSSIAAGPEASISGGDRPQAPPAHLPTGVDFAKTLQSLAKGDTPPPSTTFQKQKPVKKVRVQSPPPSSPESANAEHTYPKYPLPDQDDDESSSVSSESINGEKEDPFQNEAPPMPAHALDSFKNVAPVQTQPYTGNGPPPNPFQKTLEDIEQAAREARTPSEQVLSGSKAGMDVEAFKRLLLTGQGPTPGAAVISGASHPTASAGDGGSITDASSISRQSIFDTAHTQQETPRSSHEISEPERDEEKQGLISAPQPQRSASRKKPPPPPPATRHGKLIKAQPKEKDQPPALERPTPSEPEATLTLSPGQISPTSPTDVNKPLPPPPAKSDDDAKDSIFDKEAAGRLPEVDVDPEADVVPPPRPPTPPNASHSASTPVQNPASTLRRPAPPPRRQPHARSDSKMTADASEDTPPRSSFESNLSRSSSIRLNLGAPAPPPPRRGHRASPSITSPYQSPSFPFPTGPKSPGSDGANLTHGSSHPTDASSGTSGSSTSLTPQQQGGAAKAPPPPPQRNTSFRKRANSSSSSSLPNRPASATSQEPPPRKTGREGAPPPPPPPPRTRGSSKGSMDAPGAGSRRASMDSVRRSVEGSGVTGNVAPVAEEAEGADTSAADEAVKAMLADLDALQREVEAARVAASSE